LEEVGLNNASLKTVALATFGCKVNQYDSHLLEECLKEAHFKIVPQEDVADIYIVNTCTVTRKADIEAQHMLRRFKRKNPHATFVVTGCYAQTGSQELAKDPHIHYVIGNTLKTKIIDLLKKDEKPSSPQIHLENAFKENTLSATPIHAYKKTRIFLKIQDGCDDFCTFCIIPYARGKSRSTPPERIISQIEFLVKEGVKEVVLTGVSLGSYGWDLSSKTTLSDLVQKIEKETSLLRLRISSLEPEDVNDTLLEVLKNSEKFCPHFHLPLQAGDDRVLSHMKRNYTVSQYEKRVNFILKHFKDVFIGIDMICGFPGEEEVHFQNTYAFLTKLPWSRLHVFPYSPRKGTPAAKFQGQLLRSEILKRSRVFQELSSKRYNAYLSSFIGKEMLALVEKNESKKRGFYKALSRNYLPIYFRSNNTKLLNQEIRLTPSRSVILSEAKDLRDSSLALLAQNDII